MKKLNFFKSSILIAIIFIAGSCNKSNDLTTASDQPQALTKEMMLEKGQNPDEVSITENTVPLTTASNRGYNKPHYLYTESNNAAQNTILAYEIRANGLLHLNGTTISGGAGTGKALGSQGALVIDKNYEWLYAVNAGNNTVSSFKVHNDGSLTLAHTENSGGTTPVSVTVHNDLLYVLNRGSDNIYGFRIGGGGTLAPIEGSMQALSGTAVDAPQISFAPGADWLVVTEKATNIIGMFKIKINGSVNHGIFSASVGQTPFGFDFSRDRFMIVSNAAGGAEGAGSATSYYTGNTGKPKDINGAIPNAQAAPCWVATTKFGRFAYITNAATNNISSYYIAPWGGLYLVQAEAAKALVSPNDIVVASNNYHVYALTAKSNSIHAYQRKPFGRLDHIGTVTEVPASATGLATY